MEASMSAVKSVMLLGLFAMMDSERVRERLATVFALTKEADVGESLGKLVVEANDTRRAYGSV